MAVKDSRWYSTKPSGTDEKSVIRRAKKFYNYAAYDYEFVLVRTEGMYTVTFFAESTTIRPFKNNGSDRLYKKVDGRWKAIAG